MKLPLAAFLGCLAVSCGARVVTPPGSDAGTSGAIDAGFSGDSGVGLAGGAVELLRFGTVGDTRPPDCDDTAAYPTPIINAIADAVQARQAQFMIDTGDHMYVCNNELTEADTQMGLFTAATARFSNPWFMTMGNHECNSGGGAQVCGLTDVNYVAFQEALVAVSKHDNPNYKIDLQTRLGLVRIVFAADNQATQADVDQLKAWMTEADSKAYAVFVAKHHTVAAGSRTGPTWVLTDLIDQHRVTAILVAHDHKYYRSAYARMGGLGGSVPAVVCGLGAANTSYRGFCRMQQKADGSFDMIQYDDTGNPHDTWNFNGKQ